MYGLSHPYRLTKGTVILSILDAGILIIMVQQVRLMMFSFIDYGRLLQVLPLAVSKFDDVLLEHGGLPHVLLLAVHLKYFMDK